MSAYHSPLWAQFYDNWVDRIFDPTVTSEDVGVYLDQLSQVNAMNDCRPGQPFVIVEVGSGSGRLVRQLFKHLGKRSTISEFSKSKEPEYILIGTEPSAPMLEKARVLWHGFEAGWHEEYHHPESVDVIWGQASAGNFGDYIKKVLSDRPNSDYGDRPEQEGSGLTKADLIIFAAGGVSHVARGEEIRQFLSEVSEYLRPTRGRAIISVLNEFFSPGDHFDSNPALASRFIGSAEQQRIKLSPETAQRIADPSTDGKFFVKHPTLEQWDAEFKVRTDKFRVTLENTDGADVDSAELEWQLKVVNLSEWKELIKQAGLRILEVIPGDIQSWLVINKL
ncbi:hypothetical protein H2198_007106 [Neophaeococcomyces mojaviensis]|uniref:Uncharacterized protein n=1 Tax=Neophaeococcomyces mojaviensis TaxID=3383035 RepID=A0ACC3A111_9EURO|nr:hypothetical protein H2198_007106 [Knufia sp. JES_112]